MTLSLSVWAECERVRKPLSCSCICVVVNHHSLAPTPFCPSPSPLAVGRPSPLLAQYKSIPASLLQAGCDSRVGSEKKKEFSHHCTALLDSLDSFDSFLTFFLFSRMPIRGSLPHSPVTLVSTGIGWLFPLLLHSASYPLEQRLFPVVKILVASKRPGWYVSERSAPALCSQANTTSHVQAY